MSNIKPLISICIPTYNRAELLRSALLAIVIQANLFSEKVEVVVSDNCSTDHTIEVIEWARKQGPIRYHKNNENIGAGRNFIELAQVLAQGEYCWLLGDDDILREGAVEAVVKALEANPKIDYVFVSHSLEFQLKDGLVTGNDFPVPYIPARDIIGDQFVNRWEKIIAFKTSPGVFTFMGNHVLRTSLWQQTFFQFSTDIGFPTLEATFPHSYTVANHMVGRPALYIDHPYIASYTGAHEWSRFWPMLQVVRVLEFSDLLAELGAEKAMVRRYRNIQLENSSRSFWTLLTDKSTPGRQYFNARSLCIKYCLYHGFWSMLSFNLINRYFRPMLRPVKRLAEYIKYH